MFSGRDSVARTRTIHWIESVLTVASLFSLLAVRYAPPELSALNTAQGSVCNALSHDLKPKFNCDVEDWTLPVRVVLMLPTITESLKLPLAPRFASRPHTKGFRYDRPPPIQSSEAC
jgi:hypothetical protein